MATDKSASQKLEPAAWVYRGQGVEAVHAAAIAVVDADSRLTHALGDAEQVFFSRSSIKPLQALPLVEAGGLERFGFGSEELALCTASHNGSDQHRAVVAGMLEKLGLPSSALQCGAGVPLQLQLWGKYPSAGEDQDPLRHNCSGKHCGFLALAKLLGQPLERYLDPESPAQRAVREAVAQACEVEAGSLLLGTDGCSAPNFALPLVKLAAGMKNVALAAADSSRARVRQAMLAHPLLVSGERRLDYDLARAFPGNVVAKGGAEALLLLAFREPALGIAIKVLDGGTRALGPVLVECLTQLGVIADPSSFPTLERYARPPIKNARKLETGEIRAQFTLQRR
ncbi:MAG TPA: asparaginase [Polyangiaceae bacterium]|nr:asparaginase [Polyangiaceae bacterium]